MMNKQTRKLILGFLFFYLGYTNITSFPFASIKEILIFSNVVETIAFFGGFWLVFYGINMMQKTTK